MLPVVRHPAVNGAVIVDVSAFKSRPKGPLHTEDRTYRTYKTYETYATKHRGDGARPGSDVTKQILPRLNVVAEEQVLVA